MSRFIPFSFVLTLSLLLACNGEEKGEEGKAVARINNSVLYESDLEGIIPPESSAEDSLRITKDFIDTWLRQELLLDMAEKSLTVKQKDVSEKLEEYRRSLLIYQLESSIIKQRLDTAVAEEEIEAYYEDNHGNFELKENIVRVLYVKVTPETPDLNRLRQLMRAGEQDDALVELEEYAVAYAANYFVDPNTWLYFNDLLKEIPLETYNQEVFLRNNRYLEKEADGYMYFVRFLDFRIREGVSPLSLERDRIQNIIINRRKLALLKEFEEELFQQAMEAGDFTVY